MKVFKVVFLLFFSLLYSHSVSGFETHDADIYRTFNKVDVLKSDSITITVNFNNFEKNSIQGFFYTEQIPEELYVNTVSIKINGEEINNYTLETGFANEIYPNHIPYRWILEFPPNFGEKNPVSANADLEIIYTVSSSESGTFDFKEFSWIGYFEGEADTGTLAFGHSEEIDKQTVAFTDIGADETDGNDKNDESLHDTINSASDGGSGCFVYCLINGGNK